MGGAPRATRFDSIRASPASSPATPRARTCRRPSARSPSSSTTVRSRCSQWWMAPCRTVPRWRRCARVSSLNQGLALACGEIVLALDGDTSFDNDMVRHAVRHFADSNVVAVAGNLRVRNARRSFVTRLQALEYALSIHLSRAGLDAFNLVNNISGAFGIFRRDFLRRIGGWDSGTAEDLDLTLRIKKYFARHPNLRIRFEPRAMGHTDAPETFRGFLKQRLRWDVDLSYLYLRKYGHHLRPGLLGLRN